MLKTAIAILATLTFGFSMFYLALLSTFVLEDHFVAHVPYRTADLQFIFISGGITLGTMIGSLWVINTYKNSLKKEGE